MKNRIALMLTTIALVAILVACAGDTTVVRTMWVTTGGSQGATAESWSYAGTSIRGNSRRDINFTEQGLNALFAQSSNSNGNIYLTMTQGAIEQTIDLSDSFYGYINTSGFEPGQIRLVLQFETAEDVDLFVGWAY